MKEIDEDKLNQLINTKGWMMMLPDSESRLFWLKDFKYKIKEETPRPTFFNRNPKPIKSIYLTNIELISYNFDGEFQGLYSYDVAYDIITVYDLYKLKKAWISFKKQLASFGFTIVEIKELNELKQEVKTIRESI